MQVMIPAEYRQSARWLLNLDAGSFAILVGGAAIGFENLRSHGALFVKIPESLIIVGIAAVLSLARWPLDHGDRPMTWLRRGWDYYFRARRGSAWGE